MPFSASARYKDIAINTNDPNVDLAKIYKNQPDFSIRVTGIPSTLSIEETRSKLRDILETRRDSLGEIYELRVVRTTASAVYMSFITYESYTVQAEAAKIFNDISFQGKRFFFKFTPGGYKKIIAAAESLHASANIQPERRETG